MRKAEFIKPVSEIKDTLKKIVLPAYDVREKAIFTKCKLPVLTQPRFIYWHFLYKYSLLNLREIAKMSYPSCSPTNVFLGIRSLEKKMSENSWLRNLVLECDQAITSNNSQKIKMRKILSIYDECKATARQFDFDKTFDEIFS